MRRIVISTLLFLITLNSFCQQTNLHQDYIVKSKNQKKAGWILLGGGAALITGAIVIPQGKKTDSDPFCFYCSYANDGLKAAFFVAGSLSALASIPLFIASRKNHRKATSVSFKNEKALLLKNQGFVYTSFPALEVKYNF